MSGKVVGIFGGELGSQRLLPSKSHLTFSFLHYHPFEPIIILLTLICFPFPFSAKSIAVLSSQPAVVCATAEAFGRHLGLAFQVHCSAILFKLFVYLLYLLEYCVKPFTLHFHPTNQIVDDVLDLTVASSILGKPALNDIKSGLATVPVCSQKG